MRARSIPKEFLTRMSIFLFLFSWVIAVNYSILAANLIYPEQSYFYVINQHIHSLRDLIQVYVHPQMLNIYTVPFFRPSGNFLIYQILIPLLGWEQPLRLIIVNFLFLTLIGFFLLQIYQILFPRYKMGGYIAFSIYLMHPALTLSRFIAMHFEFAYVFFLVASLYCFMIFCQRNTFTEQKIKQIPWFVLSLLLYIVAVTFKESAVMLGPVLILYLICQNLKLNRQILTIVTSILAISMLSGAYLTLQWPYEHYALHHRPILSTLHLLIKDLVAWDHSIQEHPGYSWCESKFPWPTQIIMGGFIIITLWNLLSVFIKSAMEISIKKSFLFVLLASMVFFLLPLAWSMAFPWHLSLTILFLSISMGFSVDYLILKQKNQWLGIIIILMTLCAGIVGCHFNINYWKNSQLELTLNRNAILHPPALKEKLNNDSILVVEDSLVREEYKLGNSAYSILQIESLDYKALHQLQHSSFMKYDSLYTGTLFHWAYLLPNLKEQVLAFNVENLSAVPLAIIYTWLQHFDNIFCVGYDKQGNWHDRTELFKANLLKEKIARGLDVTRYKSFEAMTLNGVLLYSKNLLLPIPELCQLECEQNQDCKGVTYLKKVENKKLVLRCDYFSAPESLNPGICEGCKSFVS